MSDIHNSSRRIEILRDSVAKKIAAGEVIDRPFSVLRELLDNAIDSGADNIEVRIESGGINLIQVRDNGMGMSREDLQICWRSHATSKIRHEDDLTVVRTLGFRGEALSSISAVSRLEITSKRTQDPGASLLYVDGESNARIDAVSAETGTRVSVKDLFYNLPARKKFLKSPGAETRLCRQTVLEKAAAHPAVSFRFFVDGQPRDLLPAIENGSLKRRIAELFPAQCPLDMLNELSAAGEGVQLRVVLAMPPLHRSDRKYIQIYCNRRRIHEFSLMHAVEYAMDGLLPGGSYPIAFVFLDVDPSQVDFNIHPAKREVRFDRPDVLHKLVRSCIQQAIEPLLQAAPTPHRSFDDSVYQSPLPGLSHNQAEQTYQSPRQNPIVTDAAAELPTQTTQKDSQIEHEKIHRSFEYHSQFDSKPTAVSAVSETMFGAHMPNYRYLGQIFSLFLLVEIENSLYIIDMHAAHERILYEKYRASKASEELLIPLILENEDPLLISRRQSLSQELNTIGFSSSCDDQGNIHIQTVPAALKGREKLLTTLIRDLGSDPRDLELRLYENMACRTAVKDGDILEPTTARSIIEQSWNLPVKRCPHGRPIWFSLSKHELFQLVGRVV